MNKRLLTLLMVISLLFQNSVRLWGQDNPGNAANDQAGSKVYLPLVNQGQATSSLDNVPVYVDFAPGTDENYIRQIYATLYGGEVQPAYNFFGGHWNPAVTAYNVGGSGQGQSLKLTWSIIPDDTPMPKQILQDTDCNSELNKRMNIQFASQGAGAWQREIAKVFDEWSAVSGIIFERVQGGTDGTGVDDGAPWPSSPGLLGVRGDIRIGGCYMDGVGGVLGVTSVPGAGDMKLDAPDSFFGGLVSGIFHSTVAHELGHGLGLGHVCPVDDTKLMEPALNNQKSPQHDDIRGIQRLYGDPNEKPGARNDTAAQATDLGAPAAGVSVLQTNLGLDANTDQDWFRLTVVANQQLDVSASPVGLTYLSGPQNPDGSCSAGASINSLALQNLGFEIRDANGTTILATANSNGAGLAESLSNVALGAAGTKYIRIFGAGTDDVQLYNLQLTLKGGAAPTATPTNTPLPPTPTFTPTNTPVPPTATATPTNTPVPPTATFTPTKTPVPPTATPTNTAVPPTPTRTNTPVPPTPTPTNTATPAARACYWIESKLTGYVLDINGANQNPGAQAIVWSKNVPDSANQLWYLNSDGTIESKLNGFVLDINGGNPAAGTNVIAWPRNTPISNNQLWNQVDQGFLFYTIQSRLQGYLLALQNGSNAKGTLVVTAPQGNPIPDSQKWKLNLATSATCAADLTAPWAKPSQSPAPNANGWNNTDVTVTWNWSDYGGSGLNTATCPASSTSTGQGTITLSASCRDNAGNIGNASYTVKVDKTLPTISGAASAAGVTAANAEASVMASGGRRWFKTNVNVGFTCADQGSEPSGLDVNTVAGRTVTTEGAGQAVTNTGDCVDLAGNRALPSTVSEINIDKTAPTVACSANPNTLWPPNHKLKDISTAVNVNDSLSGVAGFTLLSVTSNEPDNGLGDGDTANDIQGWSMGTPDAAGQLRAERSGTGNGRIYTLTYQGADVAGNVAACRTTVTVAHNQGAAASSEDAAQPNTIFLPLVKQ
ncbi:MAG: RICIN domain-containing protein [Caldilineaceae bacterium]